MKKEKGIMDRRDFDDDLKIYDTKTFEMFQNFEAKNAVHEYFFIYHFHYFKKSFVSINHTMLIVNRMFAMYKGLELIVERKRCLATAKEINNTSNDAKDVYYASKYFIQLSQVQDRDKAICSELPLMIEHFYKNLTVNSFSSKMVPLLKAIEDTENQYKRIVDKNYTKSVASLYSSFVEEIIGDHAESQNIIQNIHTNGSSGRDIDYLGDTTLILFIHATGPNQRIIQNAKGCEILGY